MGSFKSLFYAIGIILSLSGGMAEASISPQASGQILHLIRQKQFNDAFDAYQKAHTAQSAHDFILLQQMALAIMTQGINSYDDEDRLLAIFGAGISGHDEAISILSKGIASPNPQLQLAALSFLAHLHQREADEALFQGLRSSYLPIRFQAAFYLAQRRDDRSVPAIESLMAKSPKEFQALFPVLYGLVASESAVNELRKCMYKVDTDVRVAALLSAAEHRRDDLATTVRFLLCQCSIPDAEASAYALGQMGDRQSVEDLRRLLKSYTTDEVKLAALLALKKLGLQEDYSLVELMAGNGHLFSIYALRDFPESVDLLESLLKSDQPHIQVNAALALLRHKNPKGLNILIPFLIKDSRDLALKRVLSPGKTLVSWKIVPSARENFKKDPIASGTSLHIREEILKEALDLPEKNFLSLANAILRANERELVPQTVNLLVNLSTEGARELLKTNESKIGAPLVRAYCNLALVKMKEPGPYFDHLKKWVGEQKEQAMIRFRPQFPWSFSNPEPSLYQLTPEETSRLLIDSMDALAQQQSEEGINTLLHVLKEGNPKNRYALAGLLLRTTL